jgi:hypothetical protein
VLQLRALLVVALLSACSSDDTCQNDPRAMSYVANMIVNGAANTVRFQLASADPAPPATGSNKWDLFLTDQFGRFLPSDATVTATVSMADRTGGSSLFLRPGPQYTEYVIDPLDFDATGLWKVAIQVQSPSLTDTGTFYFCISSRPNIPPPIDAAPTCGSLQQPCCVRPPGISRCDTGLVCSSSGCIPAGSCSMCAPDQVCLQLCDLTCQCGPVVCQTEPSQCLANACATGCVICNPFYACGHGNCPGEVPGSIECYQQQ